MIQIIENIIGKYVRLYSQLNEEDNPAYIRTNGTASNLKQIWSTIDKQQAILQKELYATNEKLDKLTQEKSNLFQIKLDVPLSVADAGNKKLPASVLVVNITSALGCPSFFLGQCLIKHGRCYAMKDENRLPNVRNRAFQTDMMNTRLLQLYQQGNKKPMQRYFNIVETYIQLGNAMAKNTYRDNIKKLENSLKRPANDNEKQTIWLLSNYLKISDIRINESGDFPCQLSVDLWTKFARKMKRKYGIDTHAYTARKLDFSKAKDVIAINPSHDKINVGDTPRQYRAVTDAEFESLQGGDRTDGNGQPILAWDGKEYFYKCQCTEGAPQCDKCNVCFKQNKTGKPYVIYVRLHGLDNANGFKNLFTPSEFQKYMEMSKKEGWVSQEEIDDLSKHKKRLGNIEAKQQKAIQRRGSLSPTAIKKKNNRANKG